MRNEQNNIGKLIKCLMVQQWAGPMQVIIVDDHSTDHSVAVAQSFIPLCHFQLLVIANIGSGKKAAISTGVQQATFPIILTTDADCQMGKYWVQTMYAALQQPGTRLVTGPVCIAPARTWIERFQAVEMAALIGSTAAFIRFHMPNMGNGANMGYWREVFEQVGGYRSSWQIASGDDEFLIQQVHDCLGGGVRFVKSAAALVTTAPQTNWRALLMQRRRWAAKWRSGRPMRVWGVALLVGLYHLFWAMLPCVAILSPSLLTDIICAFSLKLASEYVFLNAVMQLLRQRKLIGYLLPLQVIYSWYVVCVGVGAMRGGFVWKERVLVR